MMRADVARRAPAVRQVVPARPARRVPRLAAYVVDWLVTVIVASVLISIGGMQLYLTTDRGRHDAGDASLYAFLIISALVAPVWLIVTLAGWSLSGRSIGKLALGLRIVDRRGRPPRLLRGAVRLIVYTLVNLALLVAPATIALRALLGDALPGWALPLAGALALGGLAALLPALLSPGGRPLHDLAAGTQVVEEHE